MLDAGGVTPLRLVVGEDEFDLSEISGDRMSFLRVKSLFDGRHTVSEIAELTGETTQAIQEIVDQFSAFGLLRHEASTATVPINTILPRLRMTTRMWRRQIGFHRIFQELSSGLARREVLDGLFIETFHVVRAASYHIGTAISACPNEHWRILLSKYLADEYDHAPLLLNTCQRLGYSGAEVENAQPVIGTTSLIGMLADIGRRDTLAYFAALGLLESNVKDMSEGVRAIETISENYKIEISVFDPVLRHFRDDISAGHASIFAEAVSCIEYIDRDRLHSIVNIMHDLKHAYDQFHEGVYLYYSDISNYIPRLKVDYFSL